MFKSTLLLRRVNKSSLCSDSVETVQQTKQAHDAKNIPPYNLTKRHQGLVLISNSFTIYKKYRDTVNYCVGRMTIAYMKVKNDHRSIFSNLSKYIFQYCDDHSSLSSTAAVHL